MLLEYEGWAVEATELKRLASPDADRSDLRRDVRGLLHWGMIHEWSEEGRRYYELDLLGWTTDVPLD